MDFDGGDNYDARFIIRGYVAKGDEILVRMQSGRLCRYQLFSVLPDFSGKANWKARGIAIEYWHTRETTQHRVEPVLVPKPSLAPAPAPSVRPDRGQLATLQSGFTLPTSEFWKVRARNEASSARANSIRPASYLSTGFRL